MLAGNDKVKTDAGREGLLPLIVTSMDRHVTRAVLVEAGCSAITSLTLRQSENSIRCPITVQHCNTLTNHIAALSRSVMGLSS